MKKRRSTPIVVAVLAALALSSQLRAQVVVGQVVDSTSGLPVGRGFVVLLDTAQNEVARVLSSGDGHFSLAAPRNGTYLLRSERIGYNAFTSQPLELTTDQPLSHTLRVLAYPVMLAAVEVRGEDRCHTNPDQAEETALVWQEIRKALAATAWDGTQELARYRNYNYERELSANRRRIGWERGAIVQGMAGQPYISLPAEQLAAEGYIVGSPERTWYLPDAAVLLDESFLNMHCFRVVRDSRNKPGQVGLAFDLAEYLARPDVKGALWLDETTSELRMLEVEFTDVPEGIRDNRVGGTVEFLMLPSGAWIVHRWQIRTPIIALTRDRDPLVTGVSHRATVRGFRDTGGEVLEITTRDGATLFLPSVAHLTGVVYDSSKAGPISGARVFVEGTDFAGTTDGSGAFHFTAPLDGEYPVSLSHVWIDSVGYRARPVGVRLRRGDTTEVSFAIPHVQSNLRRLCPDVSDIDAHGSVVGVVRGNTPGERVGNASVAASWQVLADEAGSLVPREVEQIVETDDDGFYVLCGLPVGHPLEIRGSAGDAVTPVAGLIFPRNAGGTLLYTEREVLGEGYAAASGTDRRVWKLDLRLGREASHETVRRALSGIVYDRSTGEAVSNVTISLNGTDTTVTRADGTFDIVDVGWLPETNFIATRRMGYLPWGQEIRLEEGTTRLNLRITILPQAVSLDPLDVTAAAMEQRLVDVGFYARQQVNAGYFMEREQIERRLGSAMYVTELLSGIPGIDVIDAAPGSFGSTVRFRGIQSIQGCGPPRTMVDGVVVEFESLEMLVRPEEVYAIEAYRRPTEIPTEYRGADSACGVLLIWTARGRGM